MTIEQLASKHKLRIKKDDAGDPIIPGVLGQLYMYDENEELVGAMFIPDKPQKGWTKRRDELVVAGAKVVQNGDTEGAVSFPAQSAALKLAVRLLKIYRKKTVSPEQRKILSERLSKARESSKFTHRKGRKQV